ncbi:MAG: hypothetical protein Q7K34_00440 [archaeon]|nr:hypothetical protein [archaeon]
MATDEEVMQLWNSFSGMKQPEAIIRLYRLAEDSGKQAGILTLEKELLSDATIEKALQNFGWGRRMKSSTITVRAIIREATRLAIANVRK